MGTADASAMPTVSGCAGPVELQLSSAMLPSVVTNKIPGEMVFSDNLRSFEDADFGVAFGRCSVRARPRPSRCAARVRKRFHPKAIAVSASGLCASSYTIESTRQCAYVNGPDSSCQLTSASKGTRIPETVRQSR